MAFDGREVICVAAEFKPDVMMLDMGLPSLNRYEVAKQIRVQPHGKESMLIAMAGYGQHSDRQSSAAAGFDHHLVKPARFEQLLQILYTVEGRAFT